MRFFTGTENTTFVGNPEGKTSSDECRLLIQPFMTRYFSYEETFVCISIRENGEENNLGDAYGFQFELKPEIVNDIAIVCAGDFQNVIYAAYCALLKGKGVKEYVGCFTSIAIDADCSWRERVLADALSKAKQAGRPYAEARLYRPLRRSDCIDPDSGERDCPALQLLNEDDDDEP